MRPARPHPQAPTPPRSPRQAPQRPGRHRPGKTHRRPDPPTVQTTPKTPNPTPLFPEQRRRQVRLQLPRQDEQGEAPQVGRRSGLPAAGHPLGHGHADHDRRQPAGGGGGGEEGRANALAEDRRQLCQAV
uniref:(northern house mosquito) hypothetical protein n=1 Tax=Culex pipiens TaxID=7175 RepID=A0A8D8FI56_CULPI